MYTSISKKKISIILQAFKHEEASDTDTAKTDHSDTDSYFEQTNKNHIESLKKLESNPDGLQAFCMMETYKNGKHRTFSDMEEEEKNYEQGLRHGFNFFIKNIDSQISHDWFIKMHDALTKGITTKDYPDGIPKGFRKQDEPVAMVLVPKTINESGTTSDSGEQELKQKKTSVRYFLDENHFYALDNQDFHAFKTINNRNSSQNIMSNVRIDIKKQVKILKAPPRINSQKAERFFTFLYFKYLQDYEVISNSSNTNPEEKENQILAAIALFCQDLDQLHLFCDGNIRTIGIFLLNKLLYEHNLTPSILKDVNIFDCLSINELVECIKEGQTEFIRFSS